jgi:hypothetical protein
MTRAVKKMLLASVVLLAATQVNAADRFSLSFFSLVPPSGWHTESDKQHRLLSGAGKGEEPPFLIVESCSPGGHEDCPRKCDLPAIEQSRAVSDLHLTFKEIKRRDDYVEYAASQAQAFEGGKASTAVRLLCGPTGFIYTALMEVDPSHDSGAELDAVIASIEWSK